MGGDVVCSGFKSSYEGRMVRRIVMVVKWKSRHQRPLSKNEKENRRAWRGFNLKALCFILKALWFIQRNRPIFMFSVKIDGHLLNSEGHKAQHYHEVGPLLGSHLMVVLGYFKVVGPPKRQKRDGNERRKKRPGKRRSKTIIQHLLSISAQLIYSTQDNSNFLSTKC